MDWDAYADEAERAYSGAATAEELSEVNARFMGRRSPLRQALREIRDPETGRQLNGVRSRLEEAEREAAARIAKAELDRALAHDGLDVRLPRHEHTVGPLPPATAIPP